MDTSFNSFDSNLFFQNNTITKQTQETFRALVNAIIPRSPGLAYEYGVVQYYGALDLNIDEYVILTLNSLYIPLAEHTANMLNFVAKNYPSLTQFNQLNTLFLLQQHEIDIPNLPPPFRDNPSLVTSVSNFLLSFTMMGYYSEWFGYGTTRLAEPNNRVLEYFPLSWKQVGYPGPSLGYRALRTYNFT